MITPKVITAATVDPVSVLEVKDHLRIDQDVEDVKLELFIRAAVDWFEWRTGRTLHDTTLEIAFGRFPSGKCPIVLPRATPLIEVASVTYLDSDGASNTWSSANYIVDTYEDVGRIAPAYGQSYPSFTPYPLNAVRIRYRAGIANGSPQTYPKEGIRQCIFEIAGALYLNRENVIPTDRISVSAYAENPMTKRMIAPWIVNHAF